MEIAGDAAIVTGAAQGIGRGIAETLLEHGVSVAITDVNVPEAEQTCDEFEERYEPSAIPIECDVTDSAAVEQAVETAVDAVGPIDILVNNAGIGPISWIWEMDESEWDAVTDTILKGTFLNTKAVLDHMIDEGTEGSIVNVSSINYEVATDGLAHYTAAKAGVSQFTKTVAGEVGDHGIRVNAVAPGSTRTPLPEEHGLLEGKFGDEWLDRTPLGHRFGEPEDIANVVAFLCSDYAGWVTGETIAVDGGQHIRGLHSYRGVLEEMDAE